MSVLALSIELQSALWSWPPRTAITANWYGNPSESVILPLDISLHVDIRSTICFVACGINPVTPEAGSIPTLSVTPVAEVPIQIVAPLMCQALCLT